ncbi:MAG: hypothetical protein QOH75_3629 [Actinomycetota bacterium]|jgi:hypothetical protein|nr:hypothetical protein [Actinomycetota bacterium]MDQ1668641.1 hypothetical protein [Actinomycetota bacterium]
MAFTRWVRRVSEEQLLTAAQKVVAQRYGVPPPPRPAGADIFWQKVYAPIYHRLPWKLRTRVMMRMPGSHRQTWTRRTPPAGPAV